MTFAVNLLPQEIAIRRAARRTTKLTISCVLTVAVALAGVYGLKLGQISAAEEARDVVQADVTRLGTEVASLHEFRVLNDTHEARDTLLASAMEKEISFARVLNDLSLGFPASSSLRSMQLTMQTPEMAAEGVSFGEAVALLSYDGYSTDEVAPGVQAVMLELEKMSSFFSPYLGAAAQEEIGTTEVTGFQGTVQLNEDAFTRRYADGLPEEVAK